MLEIRQISKEYRTGELVQRALDGVSLTLGDNEFVAILGPSGSGKTTLLNVIGGLDRYDSGEMLINGVSTKNYRDRDWDTYRNHSIGFVFQSYNLIPHQTVLANVELALTIGGVRASERKARAQQALAAVGLGDQGHKRPNQLSGGQMQRVAIARALVNDPEIVLADEPTGALDSETSAQVMELLKAVAKNRLVVMVTHNSELAEQYATRIVRLRDGKIVGDSVRPASAAVTESGAAAVGVTNAAVANTPDAASVTAGAAGVTDAAAGAVPAVPAAASSPTKKRAKMRFGTALALSFNNLRTKKARTILTSFAGSIGIIGIALILALSTGVNAYIENTQRETMSSYPITINAQTMDFSVMQQNRAKTISDATSTKHARAKKIYADPAAMETAQAIQASVTENDLTAFKKYLADPHAKIREYLGENGITYEYATKFSAFTENQEGKFGDTDGQNGDSGVAGVSGDGNGTGGGADGESSGATNRKGFSLQPGSAAMMSNLKLMFGGEAQQTGVNFSQLPAAANGTGISPAIRKGYELVSGKWPAGAGDAVLVLTANSGVDTKALYNLGLISTADYDAAADAITNDKEPPELSIDFADAIGHSYYVLPAALKYREVTVSSAQLDGAASGAGAAAGVPGGNGAGTVTPNGGAAPAGGALAAGGAGAGAPGAAAAGSEPVTVYADQLGQMTPADIQKAGLQLKISGVIRAKANDATASIATPIAYTQALTDQIISATDESAVIQAQEADPEKDVLGGVTFAEEKSRASEQGIPADSVNTYEKNLTAFGKVSYEAPRAINIYVDTFEDKDGVKAEIDAYNAAAPKDQRIVYTDFVALLTSSITSIINVISYILIAFVAVSLIVSCIMIGIITHISVMERTKEIGILRALGASKRNVAQVFNAETVIIGLLSGLLGVGISLALTVPINAVIHQLVRNETVQAQLPILAVVILVAISLAVTVFGGLWPAKRAAKKDPVIALRSE